MTDPLTEPDALPPSRPYLGNLLFYVTLTLLLLVYSLPSIGVLLTSFKTTEEIARDGLWAWPQLLRFTNFSEAWVGGNVLVYGRNSLLVTLPATAASILLGINAIRRHGQACRHGMAATCNEQSGILGGEHCRPQVDPG